MWCRADETAAAARIGRQRLSEVLSQEGSVSAERLDARDGCSDAPRMDDRTKKSPANLDDDGFPIPRMGEDGKPVYDQEFFLALARLGKDAWNRWRAANPYIVEESENYIAVTFEGIDFREPANAIIDFSLPFWRPRERSWFRFDDGPNLN